MPSAGTDEVFETPPNDLSGDVKEATEGAFDTVTAKLKKESPFANSTSTTAQDLTSRLLDFLANASNETLVACLVGLGATTYFLLGRLGLVLIGGVGGVVLHATWEGDGGNAASTGGDGLGREKVRRKKREGGLDVVYRVLDWRDRRRRGSEEEDDLKMLDYSAFQPETAKALESLTEAVVRDYVKWWYTPILPKDQSFPAACRHTLTSFILAVSSHLSRKRPADTFLEFVTNSSSIIIVFLSELSSALSTTTTSTLSTPSELIVMYLEDNPESSLANVLDTRQQRKKLEMVAEDILQNFLEAKSYNCEPARVFLREILAGVVLEMSIQSCSKPEWINEWIIYLLEDGEPELMNVIDAGVTSAGAGATNAGNGTARDVGRSRDNSTCQGNTRGEWHKGHKKRVSKAEEAMEEAMLEARRLSQLIAEDEAERARGQQFQSQELRSVFLENQTLTPSTASTSVPIIRNGPLESAQNRQSQRPHTPPNYKPEPETQSTFTSFDQIAPASRPTALQNPSTVSAIKTESFPMTLYNANISIFDDALDSDKVVLRNKPTLDYLIQIEPASSVNPGWMIVRKYADFETLHEVLRRISVISGVGGFVQKHSLLPGWKGQTKVAVRTALERYLVDALRYKQLAESEGMKRFLEKEQAQGSNSPNAGGKGGFPGIGWPNPQAFETMGKGMLDALTSAPKGAAQGGKALFGGMTEVLGGVASLGQKKQNQGIGLAGSEKSRNSSSISLSRTEGMSTEYVGIGPNRESEDNYRYGALGVPSSNSSTIERRHGEDLGVGDQNILETTESSPDKELHDMFDLSSLPPPPSNITDDYGSPTRSRETARLRDNVSSSVVSVSTTPTTTTSAHSPILSPAPSVKSSDTNLQGQSKPQRKPTTALTEEETQVTVELIFAIINELYTLSSAWNIRRTLLTAAKTFLLRPGNPNLEAIRQLLHASVIEANTSDSGIASHLRTLEKNCLPTEEELKTWPPPKTEEEKERLRVKARKLLVERGMPQTLTSVMGAAASREALGRVFDCLQVEDVSRGLMFGLMLQGLRAVTQ